MTPKFSLETIPQHSTASNATFEIDVWRYFYPDATKTVYLQAGIYGIELTSIPIVNEFMKEIEGHQLVYNTVYLQAGIHGIELIGIPVVHELMNKIETHQLVYNTEYGVFQM